MYYTINNKKFTISNLMVILFATALVVLPFNALFSRLPLLGELSTEAAVYPMLLLVLLYGIKTLFSTVYRPKHISFILLLCFLAWIIISGAVNTITITENFTKGRTGINKYSLQLMVFILMLFSAMAIYHLIQQLFIGQQITAMLMIRRWILYSFMIAGAYSLIEIPYILDAGWAGNILEIINPLIRTKDAPLLYGHRLRSVSGEASWFAMYMAFAFPWLLSYIFTEKRRKWLYFILSAYALLMIFFTYSRTAYVITAVEFISFVIVIAWLAGWKFKKYVLQIIFGILIASTIFVTSVESNYEKIEEVVNSLTSSSEETKYHLSNVVRFGMQTAGWRMAFDHPFFGVGFGQFGFHVPDYVPSAALVSLETINYISSSEDSNWAPVHGLFPRIASETGFVGLLLWFSVWFTLLWSIWKRCRLSIKRSNLIDLTFFISIIGTLLVGFNVDTFRFFGYWFLMAIGWVYVYPFRNIQVSK